MTDVASSSRGGLPPAHQAAWQALVDDVARQPWDHDFFALLRRVERLARQAPRLGLAPRPSFEPLRLGQEPALDFAPASLSSLQADAGPDAAPRLSVRLFGLLGPEGPMPLHLTEYVRERLRQRGDPTLARFLDLFHHRLLLLFWRAWAQSQPAVQADRPEDDRYAAWLGALGGVDEGSRPHDTLPQSARLYRAGLLGHRSRHPEGLEKLLGAHFGVPVRVQPWVAHWLPVAAEDRTRLGYARLRAERLRATPPRLGKDASAGDRVWDRQSRFRLVLGPLTRDRYDAFLPGGSAWAQLRDWVREYVGLSIQWDLQLRLAADQVPRPHPDGRLRLGLTSWLGHGQGRRAPAPGPASAPAPLADRDDLTLRPSSSFLLRRPAAPSTSRSPGVRA